MSLISCETRKKLVFSTGFFFLQIGHHKVIFKHKFAASSYFKNFIKDFFPYLKVIARRYCKYSNRVMITENAFSDKCNVTRFTHKVVFCFRVYSTRGLHNKLNGVAVHRDTPECMSCAYT